MKKDVCRYKKCKRNVWEHDSRHCIFHSKKSEKKKEIFNKKFKEEYPNGFIKEIEDFDSFFSENDYVIDLEGFVFPEFDFFIEKEINYNISFLGAEFSGEISFLGAEFSDKVSFNKAQFLSEANFIATTFLDRVEFLNSKFEKKACFKGTEFSDVVFFIKTKFLNEVTFKGTEMSIGARFLDGVSFLDAEFSSEVDFFKVKFSDEASFKGTTFFDKVSFSKAEFLDRVDFLKAKFIDEVSFIKTKFSDVVGFEYCKFEDYVDFRVKKCNCISLEESINRGIIDFKPRKDETVEIEGLVLFNMKNLGQIYIDWTQNNVKYIIENQVEEYAYRANQYRVLKENFHELGEYEQEDKAYVEFKRNLLRTEKDNYNKLVYNLRLILEEKIGFYGTSPKRVAISMLVTILSFAGIYMLPPVKLNTKKIVFNMVSLNKLNHIEKISDIFNSLITALYHSIVTFLTIGYGDISPTNFLAILFSGIEGFIGLFLMSYFTVAFVRKVLR